MIGNCFPNEVLVISVVNWSLRTQFPIPKEYGETLIGDKTGWSCRGAATTLSMGKRWSATRPVGPTEVLRRPWVWGNVDPQQERLVVQRCCDSLEYGETSMTPWVWGNVDWRQDRLVLQRCWALQRCCDSLEYRETSIGNETGWSCRGAPTGWR